MRAKIPSYMEARDELGIEIEIREHSDGDFFPKKCPACTSRNIKKLTHHFREIQDLGTPFICRRIHYERVYFKCNECALIFTIEHPLIPINARYMPGVIIYATRRILEKGDTIRRVTRDLNELHLVKVSETTVQRWINHHGKKENLPADLNDEKPPERFSGFLSLDGTFKSVKIKKNDRDMAP